MKNNETKEIPNNNNEALDLNSLSKKNEIKVKIAILVSLLVVMVFLFIIQIVYENMPNVIDVKLRIGGIDFNLFFLIAICAVIFLYQLIKLFLAIKNK